MSVSYYKKASNDNFQRLIRYIYGLETTEVKAGTWNFRSWIFIPYHKTHLEIWTTGRWNTFVGIIYI